jgi:hypothetical protein
VNTKKLETSLKRLVNATSKGQARYVRFFIGPEGLIGVVFQGLKETSKTMVGWKPPGADILIIGSAIDTDGNDLTAIATKQFLNAESAVLPQDLPSPTSSASSEENEIKSLSTVEQLSAFNLIDPPQKNQLVSVVIDPSCIHCKRLMTKLRDEKNLFKKKGISVRVVPIANPGTDSVLTAANILQYGPIIGPVKPFSEATPTNINQVNNNTSIMLDLVEDLQTPLIIWNGNVMNSIDDVLNF